MRPVIGLDPRQFGRRAGDQAIVHDVHGTWLPDDLKLFATTFLGGFLFVAVYLA